jgi:hypothetical protein
MNSTEMNKVRELIVTAAEANGYNVTGKPDDGEFQLELGRKHVVDFMLKSNSSGYLQVHLVEEKKKDEWAFGRAVYSIRSVAEAFLFCNVLSVSALIAARRLGES